MKRPALIVVALPLVLAGCSYSPSTGWQWDEPAETTRDADRWLHEPLPMERYGFGVSPRIGVGNIDVCNIAIDGVSVCAPR